MRRETSIPQRGITLKRLEYNEERRELSLEVDPQPDRKIESVSSGSPIDVSLDHTTPKPFRDWKRVMTHVRNLCGRAIGRELKTVNGTKASYRLNGSELFVRAVVSCDASNLPLIDEGLPRMAWTQPVGLEEGAAQGK